MTCRIHSFRRNLENILYSYISMISCSNEGSNLMNKKGCEVSCEYLWVQEVIFLNTSVCWRGQTWGREGQGENWKHMGTCFPRNSQILIWMNSHHTSSSFHLLYFHVLSPNLISSQNSWSTISSFAFNHAPNMYILYDNKTVEMN